MFDLCRRFKQVPGDSVGWLAWNPVVSCVWCSVLFVKHGGSSQRGGVVDREFPLEKDDSPVYREITDEKVRN